MLRADAAIVVMVGVILTYIAVHYQRFPGNAVFLPLMFKRSERSERGGVGGGLWWRPVGMEVDGDRPPPQTVMNEN